MPLRPIGGFTAFTTIKKILTVKPRCVQALKINKPLSTNPYCALVYY